MVKSLAIRAAIFGLTSLVSHMVSAAPHAQLPRQAVELDDAMVPFAKPGGDIECLIPNCERCEVSNGGIIGCKKCAQNFWQVNGECVSKKGCLVPDCQTCEALSDTVCKFCNPGFAVVNGACAPAVTPQCPDNCQSCVNGQCTECNPDFFITADGQCQPCTQCVPGDAFETMSCGGHTDRECTACNALVGGLCQTCDTTGLCQQCVDGFDIAFNEQQCVMRCPDTCASCELPNQCASCHDGAFLDNAECKPCSPCGEGQFEAQACSASQDRVCAACTPCSEGYFESQACSATQDRICTACTSLAGGNCQACTNDGVCQQCKPGFNLVGQECVAVATCPPTCSACDASGTCTACHDGNYLENGQCKVCSEKLTGCTKCAVVKVPIIGNQLHCSACEDGFSLNGVTKKCEKVSCPEGQYVDGAQCKSCSDKVELCTACEKNLLLGVICKKCAEGHTPAPGGQSCVADLHCTEGEYTDGSECKLCSDKIENCATCEASALGVTCDQCADGYKPALGGLSCSLAECPECEQGSWRLNIPGLCSPLDMCKPWTPECSGFLVVEIVQPTPWMDRVCLDIWNTLLKPVVDNLTGNLMSIWETAVQCLQTSHPYQYCGCIGNMINAFGVELNKLNDSLKNLQSLPVTDEILKQIELVTQGIDFITKTMADLENVIGVLQEHRVCQ